MITVSLPFPPSGHTLFKRQGGKSMSATYRAWRDEAGWLLKQQRPGSIIGRVDLVVELVAPDSRARDADNYNKAPIDLLVAHGVIEADDRRIVREITTRWIDGVAGTCIVTIQKAAA
ncbi:RusA family crossover junction endodeoxyribonuclease [Antarcticirhabdus aurantiaca]|uniref:RusA family crossover junction endodeoxyribonuclease n=1 Tax=Antarcticirhabdus aurantiaca TaxID=2606717 RepID=A0ACD4NKW9_9HYPH|nr:RusA family crossover junction endodeoxyribonuclease [Jeongeuplla avenae]